MQMQGTYRDNPEFTAANELTALELEKAIVLLSKRKDIPKAIHVFGDDGWFYRMLATFRSSHYNSAENRAEALEFLEGPARYHSLPTEAVQFIRHDAIPGQEPCVMVEMISGEFVLLTDLRL